MAKSKIIKELANGSIDTQTALKRTKVLLQELDNDDVLRWINCEIEGYSSGSEVPEYRKISGQLYGSYFKGSMAAHMKYTHVPLPLGKMPDEAKQAILVTDVTQGIEALKRMVSESEQSEAKIYHLGNGTYCVTGWVDAENSYGMEVRTEFIVTYDATENGYKNAGVQYR